jgi:hypothetical protein
VKFRTAKFETYKQHTTTIYFSCLAFLSPYSFYLFHLFDTRRKEACYKTDVTRNIKIHFLKIKAPLTEDFISRGKAQVLCNSGTI